MLCTVCAPLYTPFYSHSISFIWSIILSCMYPKNIHQKCLPPEFSCEEAAGLWCTAQIQEPSSLGPHKLGLTRERRCSDPEMVVFSYRSTARTVMYFIYTRESNTLWLQWVCECVCVCRTCMRVCVCLYIHKHYIDLLRWFMHLLFYCYIVCIATLVHRGKPSSFTITAVKLWDVHLFFHSLVIPSYHHTVKP